MTNNEPCTLDRPTRYGLIVLAVAQGCALTFLHLALKNSFWPADDLRGVICFVCGPTILKRSTGKHRPLTAITE